MAKNSEVYKTAQEQAEAFNRFCINTTMSCDGCVLSEIHDENINQCRFAFLNLEAEEEKPLPCPFCKHPQVRVYADENKKRVYCPECGFSMPWRGLDEDVYDEYNRVAKKCMEVKE